MAIPGLEKKDLDIRIDKDRLIVQTKIKEGEEAVETSKNHAKTTRREFDYSYFKRSFLLNKTINKQKVSASYKLGILKIVLAKKERAKDVGPQSIKVK